MKTPSSIESSQPDEPAAQLADFADRLLDDEAPELATDDRELRALQETVLRLQRAAASPLPDVTRRIEARLQATWRETQRGAASPRQGLGERLGGWLSGLQLKPVQRRTIALAAVAVVVVLAIVITPASSPGGGAQAGAAGGAASALPLIVVVAGLLGLAGWWFFNRRR